jgi:predicted GNAT family N-acyltransferase
MIKVIRFEYKDKEYAEIAFEIRKKVFVEEQNVDPELEFDEFEAQATHYILFFKNKPVGAARWRQTAKGIKLERFAILAKYRNRKIGKDLLEQVLKDVKALEQPIYLHSQLRAVPFYKRAGFITKGGIFEEANIQHYLMEYKND